MFVFRYKRIRKHGNPKKTPLLILHLTQQSVQPISHPNIATNTRNKIFFLKISQCGKTKKFKLSYNTVEETLGLANGQLSIKQTKSRDLTEVIVARTCANACRGTGRVFKGSQDSGA